MVLEKIQSLLRTKKSTTPTLALLNDCRDQQNFGARALADGLERILVETIPGHRLQAIPSHWVTDAQYRFAGMVKRKDPYTQPKVIWPAVADQFEIVAEEWLQGRGGVGVEQYLEKFRDADIVVFNGEGSIYRQNLSAMRELFLSWFAKTQLGIPTVFLNGTVHLTNVVPVLPAMVRKTFAALDGVALREPVSQRNLLEFAPNIRARVIPDSAFYFAREPASRRKMPKPFAEALAGRDYFCLDPGAMLNDHRYGKRSQIYRLVMELKKLVPNAVLISSAPADKFMEQVAQETDSLYFDMEHTYYELMGLLEHAKFQVTGRYHNPILGTIVGCPTIAFASTNHKVHGACELLEGVIGEPYDSTDIRSNLDAILARAQGYLTNQDSLRPMLRARAMQLGEQTLEMGTMVQTVLHKPAA